MSSNLLLPARSSPPLKITSKAQFYDLWQQGLLGNRPRAWPTLEALGKSGYTGPVTLRYRGPAGGGVATTHVPARSVPAKVAEWKSSGVDPTKLTFHESMPDEKLLLQGEVTRSVGGLDLMFSTEPGQSMRDAMRQARTASGLAARLILDAFLDANSRDDIEALLELYPDSVVEFGAYARDVGVLPRRNTVIWEVRDY